MSESLPITSPPRRRTIGHHEHHAHHHHAASAVAAAAHFGGDSCKNTPNLSRKIEAYHQHVLDGGSQSAKSSPLPHRRLDKLEGCIRDKPSPLTLRRRLDSTSAGNSAIASGHPTCECRPSTAHHGAPTPPPPPHSHSHSLGTAQLQQLMSACQQHQQQQQQQQQHYQHHQHHHHQLLRHAEPTASPIDSPQMRRRVDSDCGSGTAAAPPPPHHQHSPLLVSRRQAVLGEPGCFSSPVHQPRRAQAPPHQSTNVFGAAGRRLTGAAEPLSHASLPSSVFASPARSISSVVSTIADCSAAEDGGDEGGCDGRDECGGDGGGGIGGIDEMMLASTSAEMEQPLQATDQTVVSGWLKFRDNKRWKIRWAVVTKLSPAADCLHLQLYRDSKDRYKNGQTKASLSLQHYLGCESGFTLDKESNTIAILCQDVVVVLAFDTRERLIQWQVKISNNLGDDIQYLVLVSSAPNKSKVATGPARMHVQDNRFCLTTGVPPKLAGLWDIAYLRRYGVVDGRFCFEGGSRCGKGEGLYVFVTDLGDEITHTLKLAAQGRLSTKRRGAAASRKLATLDSPHKQPLSPRGIDDNNTGAAHIFAQHQHQQHEDAMARTASYWPSQESRADLDSNYGCGDTVSVSEMNDSFNYDCAADMHHMPRGPGVANIERCMSCISKLGAPTMSRSSTATGAGTPATGQAPNWSLLVGDQRGEQHASQQQPMSASKLMQGLDRMSVCSSHGSYGSSGDSEYSVPRQTVCSTSSVDGWYEAAPAANKSCCSASAATTMPRRPNAVRLHKPAMPLPLATQHSVGPYENYDIPRINPVQVLEPSGATVNSTVVATAAATAAASSGHNIENYDTPKKIHEYLTRDANSNATPATTTTATSSHSGEFGNYDMPATVCECSGGSAAAPTATEAAGGPRIGCACNRVMSWADNWISLPYCRRGNGIENTGVPINKVKLSGEGKMPVVQPSGELAIYATVDLTKKLRKKAASGGEDGDDLMSTSMTSTDTTAGATEAESGPTCECHLDNKTDSSNYINLVPCAEGGSSDSQQESAAANYTNLEFALSLENYENAKEVLQRAGFAVGQLEETLQQCLPHARLCAKCGHASRRKTAPVPTVISQQPTSAASSKRPKDTNDRPENYILMEPGKSKRNLSGYLPMSPAAPPLPNKDLIRRLIAEKSASNPSLCGPAVDRSRKRVSGSCMMNLHNTECSPYTRRQLMDNSDALESGPASCTASEKRLNARKRSSSADSSSFLHDLDLDATSGGGSVQTLRKSSLGQIESMRAASPCLHKETEHCHDDSCCPRPQRNIAGDIAPTSSAASAGLATAEDDISVSTTTSQVSQSASVYIRRSASVPCKTQNRDSSSSNDSGVSTGSMMRPQQQRILQHHGEFAGFELPLTTAHSTRRALHHHQRAYTVGDAFASLPRRSKSFDPLREITFQFKRTGAANQAKCSSAEAEIPICAPKTKEDAASLASTSAGSASVVSSSGGTGGGVPFIDSRSSSSGTSDMSDYIETLSLSSSHSSSDATGDLRLMRPATSTLRPRSGKEYQNIDRSMLSLSQHMHHHHHQHHPSSNLQPSQMRGLLNCSVNYANITPVPENAESPSPGYQSGSSPQEPADGANMFLYKD